MVENRNPWLVLVLGFVTGGLYLLYWFIKTKREMNELGAKIPTAWLLIVPLVNIYWLYKYSEGFATKIKKDGSPIVWFLMFIILGPIAALLAQMEFNKMAPGAKTAAKK